MKKIMGHRYMAEMVRAGAAEKKKLLAGTYISTGLALPGRERYFSEEVDRETQKASYYPFYGDPIKTSQQQENDGTPSEHVAAAAYIENLAATTPEAELARQAAYETLRRQNPTEVIALLHRRHVEEIVNGLSKQGIKITRTDSSVNEDLLDPQLQNTIERGAQQIYDDFGLLDPRHSSGLEAYVLKVKSTNAFMDKVNNASRFTRARNNAFGMMDLIQQGVRGARSRLTRKDKPSSDLHNPTSTKPGPMRDPRKPAR